MNIKELNVYRGRNLYCHKPVIRLIVDAQELGEISTDKIPGFNEKLLKHFPGLQKHYCSLGYEGGFVTRLQEGTYLCHVTEHLILELQCLAGDDVYYGKTRLVEKPSVYAIIYEFINEQVGIACGRAALQIISRLARGETVKVLPLVERIKKLARDISLGPSTKAIFDAAKRRGLPVKRLGTESLLQISYGKHLRLIEASLPDGTSCVAADIAKNKDLTKKLLMDLGIPVPEGNLVYSEDEAVEEANALGYPVVVKPFNGNQGRGVSTNINNDTELRMAYRVAFRESSVVMVERFIRGVDFRVLVVGNKVSAVAERRPPFIVGDGVHSIEELVAKENENSSRGDGHEKPLTKIRLDEVAKQLLKRRGLSEKDIPQKNETIYLRENGNLSTGGTARDCTDEIHPLNAEIAVKAAKAIGLEVAGVDFVTPDITKPLGQVNGAIVEVNAAPGLRMHLYPSMGKSHDVGEDIINFLYPPGKEAVIPIVSVTGTNGKTTTTRLIKHVLALTGKTVGMTCTSGTFIGEKCISSGDNTGPASAQLVLSHQEVEAAVLETARGGIVRKGLGYDLADVGVIINISDDHRGQDGVDTLEELAFVKSLVVEAIKPEGYAVLNADDPMTPFFLERIRGKVIYFSQNARNPMVENHVRNGGRAVTVDNLVMFIHENGKKYPIINIKEIPITFDGMARCNVENSLAAVAALRGLNVPENIIAMGLMSFRPDVETNPGRFNIFDLGDCRVMLDYGHNISGYLSVFELIEGLGAKRLVGIIGMPGDRLDENIKETGRISAPVFDQIYIKEDADLRNRRPGEVAELMYQGVLEGGGRPEKIEIILSEPEALETAVKNALPGDLIVMFYESFDILFRLVQKLIKVRSSEEASLANLAAMENQDKNLLERSRIVPYSQ
ncbi:MAG: cyanophycin synthetase [Bacillota bacterium]